MTEIAIVTETVRNRLTETVGQLEKNSNSNSNSDSDSDRDSASNRERH